MSDHPSSTSEADQLLDEVSSELQLYAEFESTPLKAMYNLRVACDIWTSAANEEEV